MAKRRTTRRRGKRRLTAKQKRDLAIFDVLLFGSAAVIGILCLIAFLSS